MNILIIGGSYFLGRAFTELALSQNEQQNHSINVLNRGSRPYSNNQITEYIVDRHNTAALAELPKQHFDAIVDFCAYQAGDIETLTRHLPADFDRYIFISTCDVYRRGTMTVMDEDSEFEDRNFGGQAGDYITGKVALESELIRCCKENDAAWTSIRPAFIYGPNNYAPREGIYFKWIHAAGQIIHPKDATGEFQMVYAGDVAAAIYAACTGDIARNRAYNLCNPEMVTYDIWEKLLRKVTGIRFEKAELAVSEIIERGIPLPFPLTREESQWYDGNRAYELGIRYTSLEEGMRITYEEYMG